MTDAPPALSILPRAMTFGMLATVCLSLACIPSFPPCNCGVQEGELDRSEDCLDGVPLPEDAADDAVCGYPAGPYGYEVGDKFANLDLFDCEGNAVQVAQYLPQEGFGNDDTKGVLFAVGALWCQPCQIEGMEWAADDGLVDHYGPDGIQFIQALDQGISPTEAVTPEGCTGWSVNVVSDKFPILYHADAGGLQSQIQIVPNEPIPYTLIFDANANVRFRQTGGVVDESILSAALEDVINNPYGN